MLRLLAALGTLLGLVPAWSAELTVSAAASLTAPFRDIAAAFEKQHPSTTVRLNFAASGTLLQQIAHGAPVDVFATADLATMDRANAQGLIVSPKRANFALNTLVLVVPAVAPAEALAMRGAVAMTLADLALASVRRVAVGNPDSVPAGRYAKKALEKANLWHAVSTKLIHAQSVRQVLDYVARAEVDAGFVYATDAATMKDRVHVASTIPLDEPVTYPIAPVTASTQPSRAQAFVDFVTGAEAQAILARHGFAHP